MSKVSALGLASFAFTKLGALVERWKELDTETRLRHIAMARADLDQAEAALSATTDQRRVKLYGRMVVARYEGDGTRVVMVGNHQSGAAWVVTFAEDLPEGTPAASRLVEVARVAGQGYVDARDLDGAKEVLGAFLSDV